MNSNNKKNEKLSRSALRRQREKEIRYNTILDAAERLFAEQGYHQTSMEEIADMAEVSTGALYFYFKNKADLIVHLLAAISKDLRRLVGREFRKHDSGIEGFKSAGLAFFRDFCLKHPKKVAILFRESTGQGAEVEKQRKLLFDRLTLDIKEALEQISARLDSPGGIKLSLEVMAVCIVGIYERVGYHYLLWQNRSQEIMAIGRDAVEFILGGVEKLFEETKES